MQDQQLFEAPFVSKVGTNLCSKYSRVGAGKCLCKRCRGKVSPPFEPNLSSNPGYRTQWLFEAPFPSQAAYSAHFIQEVDRELEAPIEAFGERESFTGSFKIKTRLPESRKFSVTSGTASVKSSARWDRPSACSGRTYIIRLWRSVDYWSDENHGAFTFPIPGTATGTWKNLPSGTYYLEIDSGSTNSFCTLLGDIKVT